MFRKVIAPSAEVDESKVEFTTAEVKATAYIVINGKIEKFEGKQMGGAVTVSKEDARRLMEVTTNEPEKGKYSFRRNFLFFVDDEFTFRFTLSSYYIDPEKNASEPGYSRISPGMQDTLKSVFEDAIVDIIDSSDTAVKVEAGLQVPSPKVAAILRKCFTKGGRATKIILYNSGTIRLDLAMTLVTLHSGVKNMVHTYCADPDNDVSVIIDFDKFETTWGSMKKVAESKEATPGYTKAELLCYGYVVLLMVIKGAGSESDPENIGKFLKGRLDSYINVLGSRSTTQAAIIGMFDIVDLINFSNAINSLPRFKRELCTHILSCNTTDLAHAQMIMKDSGMTVFVFIKRFVEAKTITRLHVDPVVMSQYSYYLTQLVRIQNQYGAMWPWFKCIDPQGSLGNRDRYINLAMAGVAYAQYHDSPERQGSYDNIRGIKVDPEYRVMVGQVLIGTKIQHNAMAIIDSLRNTPGVDIKWDSMKEAIQMSLDAGNIVVD